MTTTIDIVILVLILVFLILIGDCGADLPFQYDTERLVEAIYRAEGGDQATYLNGIRSVSYKDSSEARRICVNTVVNNKKRFYLQGEHEDYLDFLGSRYCPVGAKNDPKGLNSNWLKNVRYFYNEGRL